MKLTRQGAGDHLSSTKDQGRNMTSTAAATSGARTELAKSPPPLAANANFDPTTLPASYALSEHLMHAK
jgi:hypothetical protein